MAPERSTDQSIRSSDEAYRASRALAEQLKKALAATDMIIAYLEASQLPPDPDDPPSDPVG